MPHRRNLAKAPAGQPLLISEIKGDSPHRQRLKELGFANGVLVVKISGHGPFICRLRGARIALDAELASHVLVEPA